MMSLTPVLKDKLKDAAYKYLLLYGPSRFSEIYEYIIKDERFAKISWFDVVYVLEDMKREGLVSKVDKFYFAL